MRWDPAPPWLRPAPQLPAPPERLQRPVTWSSDAIEAHRRGEIASTWRKVQAWKSARTLNGTIAYG